VIVELAILAINLAPWIALFMMIIARLSFIMFLMPGIGEQVIPVRLRLFILLAVAAAFSTTGTIAQPSLAPLSGFAVLLLSEIALGFFLGVTLRLGIWVLSIAGSVIAQSIGLSQLLGVAVEHEAQTLTSNLLTMAGAAILLSADFHVNAFAALLQLYGDIPLGALSSLDWAYLFDSCFAAFNFAILLAWPFVALNLLYNICLGFINKALPQLMVSFVGAPFLVGAGTIMLGLSVTALLVMWKEQVLSIIGWM